MQKKFTLASNANGGHSETVTQGPALITDGTSWRV